MKRKRYLSPESVSRRNFLKGIGACVALPAFHSLMPSKLLAASSALEAATTSTGAPLRTAFVMFPNGAIPARWWPEGVGRDFVFNETLRPLEKQRENLQVLSGLDHENAKPGNDGGGDHARGNGVYLTGVRLNKSATDIRAGISIDQAMANEVGHLTRFPSLELSCDARRQSSNCDSGYSCAYQYNISWQDEHTPMTPESNPRLVFERMFGAGDHGERAESARRRMMGRRSLLDFVMDDARRMQKRLGWEDKEKLDQYLTGVRDVELRIQKAEQFGPNVDPKLPTPNGIPDSHVEYVDLMYDMMLLAFKTDSTRIATFVLGHDGDNRSFSQIGISEGHHDLSHHQNNEDRVNKVAAIDRWYVERFAAFLDRLDAEKDLDGNSILHNSRIVYGSGNADGNIHSHDNLPIILAGAGGGTLNTGRYVKHGAKPMTNLFLSLADQAGVAGLERFGDSTGRLGNI
ncbi:DUF1552 domain-containing protein [Pelagicoccus sp. SDUM812005]|uniref:DUF1552 domain-containing protein n=1 Tax=Pelagicoccus sp. SDUM812005 TaxID=3041257 RepID=UPI00280E5518|nr:DUF1552 domain-containing protein [Pelagicoccus sp. SDUM812005]MDQ8179108.1 DUF1552 domain-containing protein [Pelagicoccus sp. SDUM812005]